LLKGFDAVPVLIEHLDDHRLTRGMTIGFNNFHSYHLRVSHVVSSILEDLAGDDVEREGMGLIQGYAVQKAAALAWWEKARKEGEEAYLVRHALVNGAGRPNLGMLLIITEKYPQALPGLYRKLLDDHRGMESWSLAELIGGSSLAFEKKLELFSYAATLKDSDHRRAALFGLKKVDLTQLSSGQRAKYRTLRKMLTDE
jgi:hypothetical protein